MQTADTARCPICHRRAPIAQGRMQPHEAGSQRCSGSGVHVRTRKPREIAESVIRDCRYQDEVYTAVNPDAAAAIRGWVEAAGRAGDRLVVAAVKVLGEDEAAKLYALDGRRGGVQDRGEELALLRAGGFYGSGRSRKARS